MIELCSAQDISTIPPLIFTRAWLIMLKFGLILDFRGLVRGASTRDVCTPRIWCSLVSIYGNWATMSP